DDLVAALYSGKKEGLRPIHDAVMKVVSGLGKDVEVAPRKTYVSLRRSKQFAIVQPSTQTRVDLGLKLPGTEPTERLEDSAKFNEMVTHRVRLTTAKDVNAELERWIKKAYEQA
ncbi:MAG: DUF5655 domain-containing protein, partial [Acidobacteriota bacterium]